MAGGPGKQLILFFNFILLGMTKMIIDVESMKK